MLGELLVMGSKGRAKKTLASLSPALKQIVFLCKGNICRSPYAEAKLKSLLQSSPRADIKIYSAGLDTRLDLPADPNAMRLAETRNVPLNQHRTTPFDPKFFADLRPNETLIIVMERGQKRAVQKLLPEFKNSVITLGTLDHRGGATIRDPYGLADSEFHRTFDRIDRALGELVKRLLPSVR